MAQFPPTITLKEAFRRILRAIYPDWPASADEIQSYVWVFSFPVDLDWWEWWFETNLTSDEVIAVNKAFELLDEGVAREKIRLRGVLDPFKLRDDIEAADARVGKLHIVAGELLVFLNNKLIKTYRQVECYETDVDRYVAELGPQTERAKADKLTDEALLQLQPEFVKNYLAPYSADSQPRPTQKELREKWKNAGHGARLRDELDAELIKQAKNKGILLKPGRQKKRAK